jgi:primosomal protein N' (replication factor Y)
LNRAAAELAGKLRGIFKERVLGPEFPTVKKIYNQYLKVIKIKVERDANDKKVKERIAFIMAEFFSAPNNKSIRSIIDVDPA